MQTLLYLVIFSAICEDFQIGHTMQQQQGPAEAIEMSEPAGVLPDQVGW